MTPLPALTRACCHLPGRALMTRSEVQGEIASRDGAGVSHRAETATTSSRAAAMRWTLAGRVTRVSGWSPGRASSRAAPPPSVSHSSHALWPGPGPSQAAAVCSAPPVF